MGSGRNIEQKRERKRDTKTHAMGSGRRLDKDQGANGEQKNQQLFHSEQTSRGSIQAIKDQLKKEAQSNRPHELAGFPPLFDRIRLF